MNALKEKAFVFAVAIAFFTVFFGLEVILASLFTDQGIWSILGWLAVATIAPYATFVLYKHNGAIYSFQEGAVQLLIYGSVLWYGIGLKATTALLAISFVSVIITYVTIYNVHKKLGWETKDIFPKPEYRF